MECSKNHPDVCDTTIVGKPAQFPDRRRRVCQKKKPKNSGRITEPFYVSVSFVLFFFLSPISGEVIQEADAHPQEIKKHFCAGHVYSERCLFSCSYSEALEWKRETLRSCKALLLRLPFSYKIDCILPPVAKVTKKIEERFIYLFTFIFFLFPPRAVSVHPYLYQSDKTEELICASRSARRPTPLVNDVIFNTACIVSVWLCVQSCLR